MEKKYFLYEIKIDNPESSFNNHFYYGKHITSNINDNYYGNSPLLKQYKNKYGLRGLIKTILQYFKNEEELNVAEFNLIRSKKEELGSFCLNLNDGGKGSFTYINSTLTAEQRHSNALASGLGNKKRLEDPVTAEQWRQTVKNIHANMSEEDKEARYNKVSQSLKEYYQTEKGQKELEQRILKNKESNIKASKEWREDFKNLFRGKQPESFRKYGKQKEANALFKQIKNLSSDIQQQKIEEFFNSLE